jgi:peptide/nickel transport system ATP-binding protein
MPASNTNNKLLEVKNLKTYFYTEDGVVKAVDGVDFYVNSGEVLGLVGESGCGKSVSALSIMRLIGPPGRILEGEILFEGHDLVRATEREMMKVRGNRISMIFQQPQSALNPVFKTGDQIAEVLSIHQNLKKEAGKKRAIELLTLVGIPEPERRIEAFPHELSGGMAQRVMIAMALACEPDLLIADEPTTALDVTIQAQILDLLRQLQESLGMAVLFITHNLGVVAQVADRVSIMYLGHAVEDGSVADIFATPAHPYTRELLKAIPRIGKTQGQPLAAIKGSVPGPFERPSGCRFHPRCKDFIAGRCDQSLPEMLPISEDHQVRCFLYD